MNFDEFTVYETVETELGRLTFEVTALPRGIGKGATKPNSVSPEEYINRYLRKAIQGDNTVIDSLSQPDLDKIASALLQKITQDSLKELLSIDSETLELLKPLLAHESPIKAFHQAAIEIYKSREKRNKELIESIDISTLHLPEDLQSDIADSLQQTLNLYSFNNDAKLTPSIQEPSPNYDTPIPQKSPIIDTNEKLDELIELTYKLGSNFNESSESLKQIQQTSLRTILVLEKKHKEDAKDSKRQAWLNIGALVVSAFAIAASAYIGKLQLDSADSSQDELSKLLTKQNSLQQESLKTTQNLLQSQMELLESIKKHSETTEDKNINREILLTIERNQIELRTLLDEIAPQSQPDSE